MLSGLRNDMICDRGLFSKLQKIKLLSLIKSFKLKSGKNFLCQKFTHIWPFQMAQRLSSYLLSGKSRKNVTLLVWFKTLCICTSPHFSVSFFHPTFWPHLYIGVIYCSQFCLQYFAALQSNHIINLLLIQKFFKKATFWNIRNYMIWPSQ